MGAPIGNKNAAGKHNVGTRASIVKQLMSIPYNTKNPKLKAKMRSLTAKANRRPVPQKMKMKFT